MSSWGFLPVPGLAAMRVTADKALESKLAELVDKARASRQSAVTGPPTVPSAVVDEVEPVVQESASRANHVAGLGILVDFVSSVLDQINLLIGQLDDTRQFLERLTELEASEEHTQLAQFVLIEEVNRWRDLVQGLVTQNRLTFVVPGFEYRPTVYVSFYDDDSDPGSVAQASLLENSFPEDRLDQMSNADRKRLEIVLSDTADVLRQCRLEVQSGKCWISIADLEGIGSELSMVPTPRSTDPKSGRPEPEMPGLYSALEESRSVGTGSRSAPTWKPHFFGPDPSIGVRRANRPSAGRPSDPRIEPERGDGPGGQQRG